MNLGIGGRRSKLWQEYIPANKVINEIDLIAEKFRIAIQEGPAHVCSSCKRTLYRHSVKYVPKHRYKNTKKDSMEFVLTGYVSFDGHNYIYMTCHRALMCGKVPVQSEYNHLQLDAIPDQLSSLCQLEQRLIAQRLPFIRGGNSPRLSVRKIFQLNLELGQKCSKINNRMFKRSKHT